MRASLICSSAIAVTIAAQKHIVSLPQPQDCDVVRVTKAVGDDLRANILRVLATDSFGVQELCSIFSAAQPALSHHLKILREADLVSQRKEGTNVFYRRSSHATDTLHGALFAAVDTTPPSTEICARIHHLNQQRMERCQAFFASNKDVLAQQDELICPAEVYLPCVMENLPSLPTTLSRALEVGPGNGALLLQLAERFTEVVGMDSSSTMLATTADHIAHHPAAKQIKLVQNDFFSLSEQPHFDALIAAMVLHHMPSPEAFFQKAARVMTSGGHLVIAELCGHTQDWVTSTVGDLWLGFETQVLTQWAQNYGFQMKDQQHLAQRNGFRVQVLGFQKMYNPLQTDTTGALHV